MPQLSAAIATTWHDTLAAMIRASFEMDDRPSPTRRFPVIDRLEREAAPPASHGEPGRIDQLDGWRGISILLVLAAHMLPLGPKPLRLNETAGAMGMSLFFTLSGFLITSFLLRRQDVGAFLVRRLCRIVPLVYLYLLAVLTFLGATREAWLSYLLFTVNYEHEHITPLTAHLWSLCVETHFYALVALIVASLGRRGLLLIPVLCLAITAIRVAEGARISIATHLRFDEIFAGGTLALLYTGTLYLPWSAAARRVPLWLWAALLIAACHPLSGPLQYVRPYLAPALIGATLADKGSMVFALLTGRPLRYIAQVSYALYVIHPATMHGWLGSGGTAERYLLKRPISFAITFVLAHLSTFYWEAWWIRLGKRLTSGARPAGAARPVPAAGETDAAPIRRTA